MRNIVIMAMVLLSMTSCLTQKTGEVGYLALGDSYTIGQSVTLEERWPEQLSVIIQERTGIKLGVDYRAVTGYTTSDLINYIESSPPQDPYELVSLLIGVNNQYQGKDFSVYETEIPILIEKALDLAGGDQNKIFAVSIPDYAYTPFGERLGSSGQDKISEEIDFYNNWIREYCDSLGIQYVYITDITREGLISPDLVAPDGLHPSGAAYRLIAERIASALGY